MVIVLEYINLALISNESSTSNIHCGSPIDKRIIGMHAIFIVYTMTFSSAQRHPILLLEVSLFLQCLNQAKVSPSSGGDISNSSNFS